MITKTNLSLPEVVETLTGFDEQYIRERYGSDIEDLLDNQPREGMRALAIAVVKHEGTSADLAYTHVMGLNMKQLNDFFADDEPEAMPEEPETESGKDVSDADE